MGDACLVATQTDSFRVQFNCRQIAPLKTASNKKPSLISFPAHTLPSVRPPAHPAIFAQTSSCFYRHRNPPLSPLSTMAPYRDVIWSRTRTRGTGRCLLQARATDRILTTLGPRPEGQCPCPAVGRFTERMLEREGIMETKAAAPARRKVKYSWTTIPRDVFTRCEGSLPVMYGAHFQGCVL